MATSCFSNNGIGISPEGLSRLFTDFSQAESDTSSKFGGTGLGLALTKRFCEMMGGTIQVRSERGVGTSFTIEIPIRSGVARALPSTGRGTQAMGVAA
jgi:signal transduction histidine kinase